MQRTLRVCVVLALVWTGCKDPKGDSGAAKQGSVDTSSVALATFEPPSIDPGKLADSVGANIAGDLFEGLVTRAADGTPVPGAASSWTRSDDGLVWTFVLRPDLKWSDGTPLGSADFEWSLKRALQKETGNSNAPMLWPIKEAEAFNKGDQTDWKAVGVAASENTIAITLERPYPSLLKLLATAYALPQPRHVVEQHGTQWTRPEHIVSNGAYVLAEHKAGQRMSLKKNPRFHAHEHVRLKTATIRFTKDDTTAHQWYQLGEIDWSVGLIPAEALEAMLRDNAPELRVDDFAGVFLLYLNAEKAPFDDVRVRRAIDLALDRGKLVRQVLTAGQRPATSIIPPQMTAAKPPRRGRYDTDAARKLLAEAGFGPSNPLPEVELVFNTNERLKTIAEFIARDLQDSIGLKIVIRNMDWKSFLQELGAPGYQMGLLAMGGFDAVDFMQLVRGDSPDNRARWKSAEYDALIEKARRAPDTAALDTVMTDAMALLDREMPLLPVYRMTRTTLLRPGLAGYEATSDNIHPLRWLRWETK
ncbi:MAG: oligopeptide transport system substrate-binding protein [Myxococcota bacterium]|jgi:oligopeptide transport system substrate-binding protein